ncbi:MAG: YkgJ family cysteine cluster protein [Verrucomicrobia bacterium]|nr:YkgJ family cysteine cluster protein [Verrucomicrobiota bacterium]
MNKPWYSEGLNFKCTGCGACCTGAPGYVWVSPAEIQEIAELLQITPDEVVEKYTHKIGGRLSLREDPKNYDCVFLNGKRCDIYTARPKQCRTFPWWKENLKSKKAWQETAERCEGVNHPEAPLISLSEIEKGLNT